MTPVLDAEDIDSYFFVDTKARRTTGLLVLFFATILVLGSAYLGVPTVGQVLIGAATAVAIFLGRLLSYRKPALAIQPKSWARVSSELGASLVALGIVVSVGSTYRPPDPVLAQARAVEKAKTSETKGRHLADLTALVASARTQKSVLSEKDVAVAAQSVRKALIDHPDLLQGWQAASEIVSYRSELSGSIAVGQTTVNSCLAPGGIAVEQLENSAAAHQFSATATPKYLAVNCRLDLDDQAQYSAGTAGRFFESLDRLLPGRRHVFEVKDSIVTYSGGPLIPADEFDFINCTFVFNPPSSVPSSRGRILTDTLMTANLRLTTVNFDRAEQLALLGVSGFGKGHQLR